MSSRVRVGHVLVIPLLGRAGLHGDVDVTRVRARRNGGVVQRVNGSMGGARLAAEMALQPLGRFEFPRLVFLLEIQRFPRQHVLTSREILSWEAWESERIRISESLFIYLSKKKKEDTGMLVETSGSHGHGRRRCPISYSFSLGRLRDVAHFTGDPFATRDIIDHVLVPLF